VVFFLRRHFGFSVGVKVAQALACAGLESHVHRELSHGLQNHTGKHARATVNSPAKSSPGSRIETLHVKTSRRTEWVNITSEVNRRVASSGVSHGVCQLYVPHTTAGVMVNEGYDPDVARDMEAAFDQMVPRDAGYKHQEGNSDSHMKAALVGSSQSVWIENGRLRLGRWQAIFFCEFDGPRNREIHLKMLRDPVP
jgi:secondary thiamine-phosphate synthase enzyme